MSLKATHFTLEEFLVSQTAVQKGIDNSPSDEHLANLQALVTHVLDPLRKLLGRPIIINSGYRSPSLNWAVGGVPDSQHALGMAADFRVSGMSVDEVVEATRKSGLPFDQLIHEFGSWTHISYDPRKHRRQVLRATKVNGRTHYSPM
jgi:hypothetical protein